jgi:hypothetical protein
MGSSPIHSGQEYQIFQKSLDIMKNEEIPFLLAREGRA